MLSRKFLPILLVRAAWNHESPRPRRLIFFLFVSLGVALGLAGCSSEPQLSENRPQLGEELRNLTGARTRVVWIQDVAGEGDVFGRSARMALIGVDSSDGRGERLLVLEPGYYAKPLITPKGDRVVFSNFKTNETFIVNWDGSGLHKIADGKAVEVWLDPETSKEWVFVQRGPATGEDFKENPIYRHEIDAPENAALVWDRTPVSGFDAGSFQVSADGTRAAGLFPWGAAGIANLEQQDWHRIGNGCWTGMSPDNRYQAWIFDGAHRNLYLAAPDGTTSAKVHIAGIADNGRGEVYHPRWSSHPRLLALTAPYFLEEGSGLAGSGEVEVVVGRFNAEYDAVEAWLTVTDNSRGDYFPDMWVERDPLDEQPEGFLPVAAMKENASEVTWPGDMAGLILKWENASEKNAVTDAASGRERITRVQARGYGRIGRHGVLDMTGGDASFAVERVDPAFLDALRHGYGMTLELTLTALAPAGAPAPVVTFGKDAASADFSLLQEGDRLEFRIGTTKDGKPREGVFELGPIPIGESVHVVVTYMPYGDIRGFIDGREVAQSKKPSGSLERWSATGLTFGGGQGASSWSGLIDGVAIYDSGIDTSRVAAHAELNAKRLDGRTTPDRFEVIARAREITRPPAPEAIAPYRRCLVVHRYEVEEVISGELEAGEILVAHWGILDGRVVTEGRIDEGTTCRLQLERFEDHPHLSSERMDMSSTAFELELFFEPLPGAAGSFAVENQLQRGEGGAPSEDR
ncbi:MAG: LamG-like jellyroll fold domain-containing protein [Opitutaceae bacterium]